MRFIPRAIGGTLRVRAPSRPDAAPTVQVLDSGGGELVAAATAATLDPVNTTLAKAIAPGDVRITLTSSTNVAVGDEYAVGTEYRATDFERIKSIAGNVCDLAYPVPPDHAYVNGAAFAGTYISFVLTAAVADEAREDNQALFSWAISAADQEPLILRFDIVRYAPAGAGPAFTLNDVYDLEPKIHQRMPQKFDFNSLFDKAQNDVIRDINNSMKAGGTVYDDDWKDLGSLKFLAFYAGPILGERFERMQEMWSKRYEDRLMVLKSQLTVDANQNTAISRHEHGFLGGRVYRG